MKVLSVAGYHHTGKTTTTVELIKELKKRGYKVASIKDIHAENFTMEKIGIKWIIVATIKEISYGINQKY